MLFQIRKVNSHADGSAPKQPIIAKYDGQIMPTYSSPSYTDLEEVDLECSVAEVHDHGPGGAEPGLEGGDTRQLVLLADLSKTNLVL